MSRMWPGFLAVWAAIILHVTWIILLLVPNSYAGQSTPVNMVVRFAGGNRFWAAGMLALVAVIALFGAFRKMAPFEKILCVLPQQLMLGISAAGAVIAMVESRYADGVPRPFTFIAADQMAVLLTWFFHTVAIIYLFLIWTRVLTAGGYSVGTPTPSPAPQSPEQG